MPHCTEFTVGTLFATAVDNGLDLRTPRLATRPEGIDDWPEGVRRAWLHDHGYVFSVDIEGDSTCALAWIAQVLPPGDASGQLIMWELPKQPFPFPLVFRTTGETTGLLRVIGFSSEPPTVTLLVRK